MPYWFETQKLRVGKEKDKRRKLTDQDKEKIKSLYRQGVSIREITRIINKVDRRAIQFILFPERMRRQYIYKRQRGWNSDKVRHKEAIKKYRQHLKEIYGLKRIYGKKPITIIN